MLKLELLLSLYTDDTLKALSNVKLASPFSFLPDFSLPSSSSRSVSLLDFRQAMEEEVAASELKLAGLTRQVAGFNELGEEFREISLAYAELRDNIAVARDDLRRLKRA